MMRFLSVALYRVISIVFHATSRAVSMSCPFHTVLNDPLPTF